MDKNSEAYKKAQQRVESLKGFYTHFGIYIIVNIFLVVLNLISSPNDLWFIWVLLGWGIGVAAHALSVFGMGGLFGSAWEEKKIKEIMGETDSVKNEEK